MKKIPNWIIVIFVLAVLIAIKFIFFPGKDKAAGAGKGKPSGPVSADYYVAQNARFDNHIYTTGKIGAFNEVELKSEISGKVTAIYFTEGQEVSKGEHIIKINDSDLQAQLQKNKIQVKLAEEKLARLKKLLAVNGIGQEEFDIQNNELESLMADQSLISSQLAKTVITAPFSGVIGLKNISEGAYVSPAQVIASLVQLKPLYVEFSLPEKYSSYIKKGLTVNFSANRQSDSGHTAKIYALEPKIDEATKTLKGRAIYKGNENFYPGTFVKVYVNLGDSAESVMIPTQCVIPVFKGQKVFVSRNGKAKEVKIITGIRTEDKIQVLQGLNPGDTVLTTGLLMVKENSDLKLIKQKD